MNNEEESDDGSIPPLVERGFFSNDKCESKTNDGNDGSSMPSLVDFHEFGYIDTDSDNDSVHVDGSCRIQTNKSSENGSVGIKSNSSWDVLPALVACDQLLDKPDNGDNNMDNNNNDDGNNANSFNDPFLVNIIINLPAPNLNNDDSFDSMVENSDASLPYNDVVGNENNPNTPQEWDIFERNDNNKVLYCSDFSQFPPHTLTDRQLQARMNAENKNINELNDYDRIRLINDFEQQLRSLRKVLQIDWDLFAENRNLKTTVWTNGMEDFDKISKQHICSSYFLRCVMIPTDYCVKVHFAERLVANQCGFEEGWLFVASMENNKFALVDNKISDKLTKNA